MRTSTVVAISIAVILAAGFFTGNRDLPRLSDRSEFRGLSRGDVYFPHERHHEWGVGCFHCHHRFVNGKNVTTYADLYPGSPVLSCSSCHGTGRGLERVHHRMCISCHRDLIEKNIKTGPVSCGRCHVKKRS